MLRKQICCSETKSVFAWSDEHFCFPDTNLASETYVSQLATMKTMLTRFQCRSLSKNYLLSVLTTIKMADCEEIEAGHTRKKGKGREKNWKDEEIES